MPYLNRPLLLVVGLCAIIYSDNIIAQPGIKAFQKLPIWIFEKPAMIESVDLYAIGVSDPGLNRNAAMKQARLRAAAMLSLKTGFRFSKMNEAYSEQFDKTNAALQSYIITLESSFDTSNLIINESYYSEFGECYVKAKSLTDSHANHEFTLIANLYQTLYDFEHSLHFGILSFEISKQDGIPSLLYKKYNFEKKTEILSGIDTMQVHFTKNRYRYKDSGSCHEADQKQMTREYIGNSFWDGYVSAVVSSLAFEFNTNAGFLSMKEADNTGAQQISQLLVDHLYKAEFNILSIKNNYLNMAICLENFE